ncbi:hypothetical protein VOI54_16560 [Tamlana sp. 2201CG12-4]|uniref:hypothetical protein n=1 Tax=Tamlana sp. 2201CG12-4 TaxID=3112582 RepID=UPI002DB7DA54|nr:hypothetical protein [Tamlana sp. 2201CG12-4]MEC3908642.1 hypothetical protein [Tamlana sp. 2201CG12-4]
MRPVKFFVFFLVFMPLLSTWAQTIEITPSYGFQFGTKSNYGRNYIQFDDSDQFGLTIGVELHSGLIGELTYFHHSSQLNIRDINLSPIKSRLSDLSADWIFIGTSKYFSYDKVRPFAGGGLGLVFLTPKNENFDLIDRGLENETKFSFSVKAGVNIMLSKAVGLNFQGNLLLPIEWAGVYIGGGSGEVSSGISTGTTTLIAGVSAGLVFSLGD